MKLVVTATALGALYSAASAAGSLTEDNRQWGAPRDAEQVFEAACDMDIELRGALAQVEVRQRIANPGPDEMAATYTFDLPRGATITAFSVKHDGTTDAALPISGDFNSVDVATRPVLGADPALLTETSVDGETQYRVRLQPIAPDHEVVLTTRYTALGEIRGGAIRLVLPGRGTVGKLTACRGTIRASAGPGATIAGFKIGTAQTSKATTTFVLDAQNLAIDAQLAIAGRDPVVWTQTEPLADGWAATLVTVASPALKTTTAVARRALFVIDGSKSMELVDKRTVARVVGTIAGALPANVEVEAIIYDRTAKRVFGSWKPGSPGVIGDLEAAVQRHVAQNGSNLAGAFEAAHAAIADGARAQTMVIAISDGVLGDVSGLELTKALDLTTSTVDVLAVVLDPATTKSPDAAVLRSPVNLYGGSFVELAVDQVDDALQVVDEWLRPAWLELEMGNLDVPATLRGGAGFTRTVIHKGARRFALSARGERKLAIAPRMIAGAGVATLALETVPSDAATFAGVSDPDEAERQRAQKVLAKAQAAHPYVRDDLAFAVLTTQGKVARNRIAMVKGGGPYEQIVAVDDPGGKPGAPTVTRTPPQPSAISKLTLERLFRDQLQPKAFACYQRALGTNPKLGATVLFEFHLGRGEITQVSLTGTTDTAFATCLEDAAYTLSLPFPDFTLNADDQTIAHYPLTFNVNEAKAVIVLGDADSTSPIDIDAIQGGVPVKVRGPVRPNAATPLGNLRPSK